MESNLKLFTKLFKPKINSLNNLDLNGFICQKKVTSLTKEINNLVKACFCDQQVLDIEFFKSSNELLVVIINNTLDIVYKEITNTEKTFHLIVEMYNWPAGSYTLMMNNKDGINIFGNFELSA